MTTRFPKFSDHSEASCWNCGADFGDCGWWSESGYGPNNGQYSQDCCKCGMLTHYDLKKKKAA